MFFAETQNKLLYAITHQTTQTARSQASRC
nr:hypothetical protein [uncultured Prevotella sp.]